MILKKKGHFKNSRKKDEKRNIDFVKKINHPIYGESLIVYEEYKDVQLWTAVETAYNINKIVQIILKTLVLFIYLFLG